MNGITKLGQSSTFWAGLAAVLGDALSTGTVNPQLLIAAVVAYGLRSLGEHVGKGLTKPGA